MQCSIELIYSLFLEKKRILPKPIINGELERLAVRIRAKWRIDLHIPRLPEIITAASLAQHGSLRSVEWMDLVDVDLASVPAEHMASLAACVTKGVVIRNVLNCDLVNILDNIKCQSCRMYDQSLNREESLALVRAMESRVESVELRLGRGEVDIKALTQYNGEGRCGEVVYYGDRYRDEIRSWAKSIDWDIIDALRLVIIIERRRR